MSKFDPKSREEAFSYQFEDDVKKLLAFGLYVSIKKDKTESIEAYKQQAP